MVFSKKYCPTWVYDCVVSQSVNDFITHHDLNKTEIDAIASHGHTVFHQPENRLTLQIGNGANISSITQLPVVCDFRTTDIALDGQGAPLVPVGDHLLFYFGLPSDHRH